jgi:methylmalonyl-CoA/ethylmalonyl-CoA epimerase
MERHADGLAVYAGALAGEWMSSGLGIGFSPAQVRYANGMKVELLAPHAVDQNDFLRRFLDRHGPGAHHYTFKVPDILAAIAAAEDAGYAVVNTDLRDPTWKETFLHPKTACGIVVQLAESSGGWSSPPPANLPAPIGTTADLVGIVHAVAAVSDAQRLFGDVLDGDLVDDGDGPLELTWPDGGRIRFVETAGVGPGRLDHIEFAVDEPGAIPNAIRDDDGRWTLDARHNNGVALVLTARR